VSRSIETKGGKIEVADAFYRLFGVCWRSASAAATGGRGAGVAVASSRASREEDEVLFVSLVLIRAKGYVAGVGLLLGPRWWTPAGPVVGLLRWTAMQAAAGLGWPDR
jgi:hypothetical protein